MKAPSVGVFRRSPSPGAEPFVEVGARVGPGQTLGTVEAMRLRFDVPAPCAGTVVEVFVDDAAAVEFDDVLLALGAEPV